MAYATVRIECLSSSGEVSTGSGYFFKFKVNNETNQHIPVVITNKHVVLNSIKGKLIFTTLEGENPADKKHFEFYIDNFETLWRKHPDNDVDLCAMPIAPFLRASEAQNIILYYTALDFSLIPNEEQLKTLSAIEEIIMIGYPNGIWDAINNKPIFRKGITATHPCFDYNGKK